MNIEGQIAEWRGFVRHRPAIADEDVEEMEAHLRDQISALTEVGLSQGEAFLVAVKRMGSLDDISREFAREHSDRLWKQLVLTGADEARGRWRAVVIMLAFAVAAALSVRIGLGVMSNERVLLSAPLLVFPFPAAYLAWTRRLSTSVVVVLATAVLGTALVLNLYPFKHDGMTELLAVVHAAVVLWFAVGVAYVAGDWRSGRRRMDFIRFTGEWVIYMALLALGGGVLCGLTAAMFKAVDIDPSVVLGRWIVPMGAAGATVVAVWLVEAKQSVIENMAPVLTRLFSPLTVALLVASIGAFTIKAGSLDANRDLLIVMAVLLVVVLGLWLYAVSAREPLAPPGVFDWVLLALLIGALAVDAIVLSAMVSRIAEFGATANKVSALGLNVVLLGNLVWSTWLCIGFLRRRRTFAAIEQWQTDYLPVYAAWAAFVTLAIPPLFNFV